jgi:hypothetical protein
MNNLKHFLNLFKDIKKLQGQSVGRDEKLTDIKILRTRIWIESLLREHQISVKKLSSVFYSENESTGSVMRWLKGSQTVRLDSVKKLAAVFKNSDLVYHLPIFDLLETKISITKINLLLDGYTLSQPPLHNIWELPTIKIGNQELPMMIHKNDSNQLYQRGDIYGFMAILILLREAELNNDVVIHENLIKDAYKALPAFCRDIRFKKRWEEFFDALYNIHCNMYSSSRLVHPRKDIIKKQIFAKEHITMRSFCPRSKIDGRFIEPEQPYIEASFS